MAPPNPQRRGFVEVFCFAFCTCASPPHQTLFSRVTNTATLSLFLQRPWQVKSKISFICQVNLKKKKTWARWPPTIIPALGRLRWDCELAVDLSYAVRLCLKNQTKSKKKKPFWHKLFVSIRAINFGLPISSFLCGPCYATVPSWETCNTVCLGCTFSLSHIQQKQ
jgi:hypothetical protein